MSTNTLRRWTSQEEDILKEAIRTQSINLEELAERLNRTPSAIKQRLASLKVNCQSRRKKTTDAERNRIWEVTSSRTTSKRACFLMLSQELGMPTNTVKKVYYGELTNPESKYYRGIIDIVLNEKAISVNRINKFQEVPQLKIGVFQKLWNKIKRTFRF